MHFNSWKLESKVNQDSSVIEDNESLTNKLQDAEQVARELEITLNEKNHIISLLKDQVKTSQNEISELHQAHTISAPPGTTPSSSSQPGTLSGISHLGTDSLSTQGGSNTAKGFDKNSILSSNNNSPCSSISDTLAAPTKLSPSGTTKTSITQSSISSPRYRKNVEKYCQNCKNEVPKDFDIEIPSPVYFYDFLSECPSPWLHYGYCSPCLEVARSSGSQITQHIAQCPAFVDQCWDGEHESLITHYEKTESENIKSDQNDNLPPSTCSSHLHSSKSESNAHSPSPRSMHSSPGPYYCTNPDEYCQNCKNEISNFIVHLPCPVQYFDFITECPSPWLHYGYCAPCLEAARLKSTEIITEHITQCEALFGQCWEGEHEKHILHYQPAENKIT